MNQANPRSSSKPNGISIVVPVEGRVKLLGELLASLVEAKHSCFIPVETIIVDSSRGATARAIQELCSRYLTRYLVGPKNVRRKRNLGIQGAKYDIVLFLDSDVIVDRELLQRHAAAYELPETGGLLGKVKFIDGSGPSWNLIRNSRYMDCFSFADRMTHAPWGPCANISYRREVLTQIGGFDETFPGLLGADDVDLGLRVCDRGFLIACDPQCIALHNYRTWGRLIDVVRRGYRWGRMHAHLCLRHEDRLRLEWPRAELCLMVVLALSLIQSVMSSSYLPVAVSALACLLYYGLMAVSPYQGVTRGLRYPYRLGIEILNSVFEIGLIMEALTIMRPSLAIRKLKYADRQLIRERPVRLWSQLALYLTLLSYGFGLQVLR